jgi:hypothetical protein
MRRTIVNVAGDKHPLAQSKTRGREALEDLLTAEGGLLPASTFASRIGVTEACLAEWTRDGRVIAVRVQGKDQYPAWQERKGNLLPGLVPAVRALKGANPLEKIQFFLTDTPVFNHARPLDWLRTDHKVFLVEQAALARSNRRCA